MANKLTKKQGAVMQRIFSGELIDDALEVEKISKQLYRRWLRDKEWQEEYEEKVRDCRRQAQLIIANYMSTAAAKLMALVDCDKEQVARQACLDILGLDMKPLLTETAQEIKENSKAEAISDEKAREILKVLAGTKEQKDVE